MHFKTYVQVKSDYSNGTQMIKEQEQKTGIK